MFDYSSVFILAVDGTVYRIELDRDAQRAICKSFASSVDEMIHEKEVHDFEVNYKPEDNEITRIASFVLHDSIKEAIRNPLGVDSYRNNGDINGDCDDSSFGFPEIKAIFVGEMIQGADGELFHICFQRYRKEQNFSVIPFRLFYSSETFTRETRFEIGITDNIDCFYSEGEILFTSFFFARQIFDLSHYYRVASEPEVDAFTHHDAFSFEDAKAFVNMANSYVRRKIAMINDSGVLRNHTAKEIYLIARRAKINVVVQNDRIVIPADKNGALEVLAFLDEEAYRGPFSNNVLLANSKRVLRGE